MARFTEKPGAPSDVDDPVEVLQAIERFLNVSRKPAVLEIGEEPIPLSPDNYAVEYNRCRLTLQAWDRKRNIVRHIVGIEDDGPGRLKLRIERFGKRHGTLLLFDQARPNSHITGRRGNRMVFRERFRRFLRRRFPDWQLALLSADADLEHSLSPVYPRALLKKGGTGWAAIGAPAETGKPSGALSFGLIWLDYLRHREKRLLLEGLLLFLPDGCHITTCLRLRHLNPHAGQYAVYIYSDDEYEEMIDPRDHGNLKAHLPFCRDPDGSQVRHSDWVERLSQHRDVEKVLSGDGSISLRVRGIEFANVIGGALTFGIGQKRNVQPSNLGEIEALAAELARLRSPAAQDRANPLYTRRPEAWLESQVRAGIEEIDPSLVTSPIYSQVPAFTGRERGIIDMLATDSAGRLAVLELKATADLHLPLQALDYWMRVRWHAERGDFKARGYFPGQELSQRPPRLMLVAPALEFHPTTEILLRYLSPEIPVERIGLGFQWRKELQIVFRALGRERPGLSATQDRFASSLPD